MPKTPKTHTYDTFDLHIALQKESNVLCSNCFSICTKSVMHTLRNPNPCHPEGTNATYAIPFCGPKCRSTFIKKCRETAPFPINKDVVFGFPARSGGPEDGFWTMFSVIPKGGKWIICQCTDEGVLLLDDRERPIWMLIEDALLREKAVRVYN